MILEVIMKLFYNPLPVMKNKLLKKLAYASLGLLLAVVLSTYFVGSYFINFALVPSSGGGERDASVAQAQKNGEGYEALSQDLQVQIALARKADTEAYEQWLKGIEASVETVSVVSKDGYKLAGHCFIHSNEENRWVIVVHGYQSSEESSKKIARHYYNRGFNALTISLRAHGNSEGQYIGMGYLDKDDLFLWTEYLVKRNPNAKIVYHGTSMGSATVLFASSLSLPSNVRSIVADCGYTDVWSIFESELKNRFGLPAFPILYMADIMGRIKAGYSIKNASVIDAVRHSHVPTLFIHTTSDDFVPVSMVHELYNSHSGDKQLYIVRGANHTEAKYVNMEAYYGTIMDFLRNYMH